MHLTDGWKRFARAFLLVGLTVTYGTVGAQPLADQSSALTFVVAVRRALE